MNDGSTKTDRIEYIDIFKGIAIILVVLQHCIGTGFLGKIILSFHMALFFFISGYIIKNISIKKQLAKGIYFLKPQFFIGIMNCVWYYLIIELLLGQPYHQRWFDYFNTWFLPTMFYVGLLYAICNRLPQNNILTNSKRGGVYLLIICLCLICTYFMPYCPSLFYKLHITKIPFAFLFFIVGVYFQNNKDIIMKITQNKNFKFVIWNIVLAILIILTTLSNEIVYWYNCQFGNLFLTTISSFCGCLLVLNLSIWIHHNYYLSKLGQNSIIVYSCQFIVYRVFGLIFQYVLGSYCPSLIIGFITFICSIIFLFLMIGFFKKTFIFRK